MGIKREVRVVLLRPNGQDGERGEESGELTSKGHARRAFASSCLSPALALSPSLAIGLPQSFGQHRELMRDAHHTKERLDWNIGIAIGQNVARRGV